MERLLFEKSDEVKEYEQARKAAFELSRVEINLRTLEKFLTKYELESTDFDELSWILYENASSIEAYADTLIDDILDPDTKCKHNLFDAKGSYWVYSVNPDDMDDWARRSFRATMVCMEDDNCLLDAIEWAKRSLEPTIYVYKNGTLFEEIENDFDLKSIVNKVQADRLF